MAAQARQVLAACEKSPTDAETLNYDPRNPFDLCSVTFTPIYRGNKFVECPFSKARFQVRVAVPPSPLRNKSWPVLRHVPAINPLILQPCAALTAPGAWLPGCARPLPLKPSTLHDSNKTDRPA